MYCTHEYMYVHVWMHVCIVCLYTCVHASMCIYMYVYMYACVQLCIHVCIYVILKLGLERYTGELSYSWKGGIVRGNCLGGIVREKCPFPKARSPSLLGGLRERRKRF